MRAVVGVATAIGQAGAAIRATRKDGGSFVHRVS